MKKWFLFSIFQIKQMEIPSKSLFGDNVVDFSVYPHQADAIQWIRMIEYNLGNPNIMKGGILADDMGLGKTRVISAVCASHPVNTSLILCPPSTRFQWIVDLLKCMKPTVTIYTIEGDKFHKCKLVTNSDGIQEPETKALDTKRGETFIEPAVLVCNYQLVSSGITNDKMVTSRTWDRIVVDEAHFLRNMNDTWRKINAIRQPMVTTNGINHRLGSRLALSGTPLQMGPQDLVNIFRFVDDRFLRGKTERECEAELNSLIGTNLFRRNRNQLTPFMKKFMRYPESEPKVFDIRITLEDDQKSRYFEGLTYETMVQQSATNPNIIEAILTNERCFLIANVLEKRYFNKQTAFGAFLESEDFRSMISYPYDSIPDFIRSMSSDRDYIYRGKMSKIEKLKEIIRARMGESFVVFHHFRNVAIKMEEIISQEFPQYTIFKINGDVSSDKERYRILERANKLISENRPVILLSSTKATSEGLNYQKFSRLVFVDSEYNHKTEQQAEGRCQRIGQMNSVERFDIAINDFRTIDGVVSIDNKIISIRDERTHLSDKIDIFNAAFTFRRHTFVNSRGARETGIYFGDAFERLPKGSVNGPDSVGPTWIV